MARFDSGILGYMRRKVGKIVARIRYNKVYIAQKPEKIKVSQTQKSINNRAVFSRRQRLNSALRKDKRIQEFWRKTEAQGLNDNTKLMIRNKPFVNKDFLLPGCGFTPPSKNKIIVNNIDYSSYNLAFDFKIERSDKKVLEPPYNIWAVVIVDIYYEDCIRYILRNKNIVTKSEYTTVDSEPTDTFINILINYNNNVFREIANIADKLYVMIAAVKYNELKNKYEWSDTFFQDISHFAYKRENFLALSLPCKYQD
ncbi:MAG: hypothetical protein WC644_09925 [Ignavibacteria bacterium]